MKKRSRPRIIFFDAVGTLFHLPKGVGYHYALVGRQLGLHLDLTALDSAFASVWKEMPTRPATRVPRPDDDKGWWQDIVDRVLERCASSLSSAERARYFEAVYQHFTEAGVWELYPEVSAVLEQLRSHYPLAVISNFDGRLRLILERLGIAPSFSSVVISSEVGSDKPDPYIFQRALELNGCTAADGLHVGDDPVRDWGGAAAVGMRVFALERPSNSLRDLVSFLGDS
ncbi:MAG: HAD-IA family hydrolase [Chthoniobacterales bacterium]